jgi:hypothetical protein
MSASSTKSPEQRKTTLAASGTSESFMDYPSNDRYWPIREAQQAHLSVSY